MSASSANRIPILQMIIAKVRRLTGSADPFQLPDVPDTSNPYSVGITDYINSFYYYDFPAQYRSLKLKDRYTFNTSVGIDTYAFDSENYTTVEMPCYCAKREILLFNDPWSFYGVNFNWQYQNNFATGDGTTGPYTGFTSAKPIVRSFNNNPVFSANPNYPASRVQNILITANDQFGSSQNVTDVGGGSGPTGNLIQEVSGNVVSAGTINYETGEIEVTFSVAIPEGNPIQIQYNPTTLAPPLSILFFQNQFVLRPVPDRGYTIELVAYRQPSQALANTPAFTGNPELSEWWETIAFGASKKIYEDRNDFDSADRMESLLNKQYQLNFTRTYAQLGKQSIQTLFRDQLSYNYGSGAGFMGASGT